jgi:hypothetical protein
VGIRRGGAQAQKRRNDKPSSNSHPGPFPW